MWRTLLSVGLLPLAWALRRAPPHQAPAINLRTGRSASITVPLSKNGQVVQEPVPWLSLSWVPPTEEPLTIAGGLYGGLRVFAKALTEGLSEDVANKLVKCGLGLQGGRGKDLFQFQPGEEFQPEPVKVWIFTNGETASGHDFWQTYRNHIGANDRMVILGNMWNETHETFHSPEVTSLWVPFISLGFAERKFHTPLDLVNRSRTNFEERELIVGYQQRQCHAGRELFWDELNRELGKRGLRGHALSKCNGYQHLGELSHMPVTGPFLSGTQYDHSVADSEHFRFMWTSEHCINRHGYITEKIANAFLAGAVPIYAGAEQIGQLFETDSFIQADWTAAGNGVAIDRLLRANSDPALYKHLQQAHQPLVSDAVMRKFFTWHPATWPKYGDGLRQLILAEALAKCHGLAKPPA